MAFLSVAIVVVETLIKIKRAVVQMATAIGRTMLFGFPDRVSKDSRGSGMAGKERFRSEVYLACQRVGGNGEECARKEGVESASGNEHGS